MKSFYISAIINYLFRIYYFLFNILKEVFLLLIFMGLTKIILLDNYNNDNMIYILLIYLILNFIGKFIYGLYLSPLYRLKFSDLLNFIIKLYVLIGSYSVINMELSGSLAISFIKFGFIYLLLIFIPKVLEKIYLKFRFNPFKTELDEKLLNPNFKSLNELIKDEYKDYISVTDYNIKYNYNTIEERYDYNLKIEDMKIGLSLPYYINMTKPKRIYEYAKLIKDFSENRDKIKL